VDLVSNTRLELGTDDIERRLARFIGAVSQLDAAGRAQIVDLRYSNGFSVTWRRSATPPPSETPPAQTAKAPAAKPKAHTTKTKVTKSQATKSKTKTAGVKATTATPAKAPTTKTATSKAPTSAHTQTDRAGRSAKGG